MKNKDLETINQLQEIKSNYINLNEGSRNVSYKKVAALNYAIRSVKKYRNSSVSYWSGFITCAIVFIIYSIIFALNR